MSRQKSNENVMFRLFRRSREDMTVAELRTTEHYNGEWQKFAEEMAEACVVVITVLLLAFMVNGMAGIIEGVTLDDIGLILIVNVAFFVVFAVADLAFQAIERRIKQAVVAREAEEAAL